MKFPYRLLRAAYMALGVVLAAESAVMPVLAEEYYEENYDYYGDDSYNDESWDESWDDSEDSYNEEEEEEEYIPEAYYAPIQTNALPSWPEGQAVQAASAIVMDMDTGAVLYGKSIFDAHYPASITKIMTLLVAVENGDLDEVITCSPEVFNIEAESSNAGIAPGEEVTLRQALYGLMLESANDLAMAIAVHIGGSVSGFAQMMNDRAAELGCVNTHFVNPHGLHDSQHYVCAYDMALIGQAAYANETCRKFMSTVEENIPPTNMTDETRYFINHQRMLRTDSEYYQSWCTGGKTGYTTDAWNTLVTFGEKNGLRLVCVLLQENGIEKQYLETTDLMNYGFDNFQHKTVNMQVDSPTFYELIGFNYPNPDGVIYQSDELKQKVITIKQPGTVTLPADIDVSVLTAGGDGKNPGEVLYYYEGQLVGSGQIGFTPVPSGIHYSFEEKRDMDTILQTAEKTKREDEIEETFKKAWNNIESFGKRIFEWVTDYIENNRMTVVLAGALVLFVLLILIAIMIMRVTSDYRIRRRRKAEERQRRRREEEIDRKSAVEIEEELREAMRQEQEKRQKEEKKAALEREKEAKLREAESVLEEIERMEQAEREAKGADRNIR